VTFNKLRTAERISVIVPSSRRRHTAASSQGRAFSRRGLPALAASSTIARPGRDRSISAGARACRRTPCGRRSSIQRCRSCRHPRRSANGRRRRSALLLRVRQALQALEHHHGATTEGGTSGVRHRRRGRRRPRRERAGPALVQERVDRVLGERLFAETRSLSSSRLVCLSATPRVIGRSSKEYTDVIIPHPGPDRESSKARKDTRHLGAWVRTPCTTLAPCNCLTGQHFAISLRTGKTLCHGEWHG